MALAEGSRTFLNIGCADGDYTTGLAARAALQQVVGVDRDMQALRAAIGNARNNDVDEQYRFSSDLNIAIGWLERLDLVLIDVDEAELEVLRSCAKPARNPCSATPP
jgi:ribosomal protein L11 methylase PrmA